MTKHDVIGVYLPRFIASFLPGVLWRQPVPSHQRTAFLTYDDGPSIHTISLLEVLNAYEQKACFFMCASRIASLPDVVSEVRRAGHIVGLHGFSHLNAWRAGSASARADFEKAISIFRTLSPPNAVLYRPPYGHLTPGMVRRVKDVGGRVVLWDLLPGDYDPTQSAAVVASRITEHIRSGSIIALHDGPQSGAKAVEVTRRVLDQLTPSGWTFPALSSGPSL